jgi:CTP:molybdopterin cytidylyltransferase MocA
VDAVVMAAGVGSRLRPVTDDYAKAVLPIDGRPVVATLLRELCAAGATRATVVTGHLSGQVERLLGDGSAFGLDLGFVRQPGPDGSADAVRRALDAGLETPFLVAAADTLFGRGDACRFWRAFAASGAPGGAIAVRRHAGKDPVGTSGGRVVRVLDRGGRGPWSGAPLWAVGEPVVERLCLDRRPWELGNAFQRAIDEGHEVRGIEIGATRDLTHPVDLVVENFPYLAAL